jgi:hypothetical protein
MGHDRLLELIWQGDIRPATGHRTTRLERALGALLPLRIVSLGASTGVDRRRVLTDDAEVMPDLPLGDVLAEELDLDVPQGALIVISDDRLVQGQVTDDEMSYDAGIIVAETLIDVIRRGVFPVERDCDALYAMARSYYAMIGTAGFLHLGLLPAWFRAGLGAGLCTYWAGARSARSDTSGLFLRPDFLTCPDLHAYLRDMDASFTAPDRIPAGLMLFADGPLGYDDWLEAVESAVTAELDAHIRRLCNTGQTREMRA